jgi:hypothetical protein
MTTPTRYERNDATLCSIYSHNRWYDWVFSDLGGPNHETIFVAVAFAIGLVTVTVSVLTVQPQPAMACAGNGC